MYIVWIVSTPHFYFKVLPLEWLLGAQKTSRTHILRTRGGDDGGQFPSAQVQLEGQLVVMSS